MLGTITRVLPDKSYGFIHSDGKFYFFHKDLVSKESPLQFHELKVTQQVSFEPSSRIVNGEEKLRAENVIFVL